MSDLNQCQFIGRLGKDPEIRSAGNSRVANFSIAVGEQWRDKQGEKQERTTWVNVVAWGDGLVGVIEKYISKGSKVFISGKMQVREYEKDGSKRWATEIVLQGFDSKLIMLDGKNDGNSRDNGGQRQQENRSSGSQQSNQSRASFDNDLDDEVPF